MCLFLCSVIIFAYWIKALICHPSFPPYPPFCSTKIKWYFICDLLKLKAAASQNTICSSWFKKRKRRKRQKGQKELPISLPGTKCSRLGRASQFGMFVFLSSFISNGLFLRYPEFKGLTSLHFLESGFGREVEKLNSKRAAH